MYVTELFKMLKKLIHYNSEICLHDDDDDYSSQQLFGLKFLIYPECNNL